MKPYIIPVALLVGMHLSAQVPRPAEKITVNCSLPNNIVRDSTDVYAIIVFRNASDSLAAVYGEFEEGWFRADRKDNSVNLKVIVEQKTGNKFTNYFNRSFIDIFPGDDSAIQIKRVWLHPGDSLVLRFHVDSRYRLDTGEYRMKWLYWNDVHKNTPIESNWFYFKVVKTIYARRYYENEWQLN